MVLDQASVSYQNSTFKVVLLFCEIYFKFFKLRQNYYSSKSRLEAKTYVMIYYAIRAFEINYLNNIKNSASSSVASANFKTL